MIQRWHGVLTLFCSLALFGVSACSDDAYTKKRFDFAVPDIGPDLGLPDGEVKEDSTTKCGAKLKVQGPACVPVLHDCKDQVPVPGGGCVTVGVTECPGGIKGPPDWKCKPIGPPASQCAPGWIASPGGWCEPVLPTSTCAKGSMEVIGKTSCQTIGSCGTGTYGEIQTSNATIFVDQAYTGALSDGSATQPFVSIGEALQAASPGAQIAIAAGDYQEDLVIDKQVVVEGRCPQMVKITGQGINSTAVVEVANVDVVLRGLTVSGPKGGIQVTQGKAAVEVVVVEGCGRTGISAFSGAAVLVKGSLVADNAVHGVHINGSTAVLEGSVVRDTRADVTDKKLGNGVYASVGQLASIVTMRDCVISHNRDAGVKIVQSLGVLERTVVRDTQPRDSDSLGGRGIEVDRGTISMDRCVLAKNHYGGLRLWDAAAALNRTIVRDTLPRASDKMRGYGIFAIGQNYGQPATLTLRNSAVVNNRGYGIGGSDADVVLERTVVKETQPLEKDKTIGFGVYAREIQGPSNLTVRDCVVSDNHTSGVYVLGGNATVERSILKATQPQASDQKAGNGILAEPYSITNFPTLTIRDSLVVGNRTAGIAVFDGTANVIRTVVKDTLPQAANKKLGNGIGAVSTELDRSSTLVVQDVLVEGNTTAGVSLIGAYGILERVAVRSVNKPSGEDLGFGVIAIMGKKPSTLTLSDCQVTGIHGVGIAVASSSAMVERSVVNETTADKAGDGSGDGIWVGPTDKDETASLGLQNSVVDGSGRAGLVFSDAEGSVHRCVFRNGEYAIVKEGDADPAIGADNVYESNTLGDEVFSDQGLKAPPIPTVQQ